MYASRPKVSIKTESNWLEEMFMFFLGRAIVSKAFVLEVS
jgi:hypothetical protein